MATLKKIFILFLMSVLFQIPVWASNIHDLAQKGNLESLKIELAKNPGSLDSKNEFGQTPLELASWKGHAAVVRFLIGEGADVNHKDMMDGTPLHLAVMGGHIKIVELLILEGAEINPISKDGRTPFKMAFERGHINVIEIFIENGIKVDSRESLYGRTLLHQAAILGNKELVEFLIRKGADVNDRDNGGKIPLDLANICDHKDIAGLLKAEGREVHPKQALDIYYVANEGFLISAGGIKVLIDSLFIEGFNHYQVGNIDNI